MIAEIVLMNSLASNSEESSDLRDNRGLKCANRSVQYGNQMALKIGGYFSNVISG